MREVNVLVGDGKVKLAPKTQRVDTRDIPTGSIRPRHLEAGLFAIKFGLAENRPETGTETKAYFATDTGVLSLWNGSAWLTETFT